MVVGAGSVAALAHVLQAYCGAGDEVVFAWRSFEAYPILVSLAGAQPVPVPLTPDARHDLDAMAAAITDRTRVVIVCSPNNPTGPSIRADDFAAFMEAVPSRVLVVLDEAYVEFVRDEDTVDGLAELGRHDNLLIMRTFSKAYGLAGMRVGYAAGPADLITPVRGCVTPFSITELASVAAMASLDAVDELLERVDRTVAERQRVLAAVREQGWDVPDAQGNFFWLPAGERTGDVVRRSPPPTRPSWPAPSRVRACASPSERPPRTTRCSRRCEPSMMAPWTGNSPECVAICTIA